MANALGYKPLKPKITNTEYIFTFGKHKGETVEFVLNSDHGYILWMVENNIADVSIEIITIAEIYDMDDDDWGISYSDFINDGPPY